MDISLQKEIIDKTTHSPWENPSDPNIGKLGSMVINFMSVFDVPLKEHDWS